MSISFGSINTGLPKDIVKQIVAAEKIPLAKMEERKAKFQDKSKLVDELSGLFQKLQSDLAQNNNDRNLRELRVITNNDLIDVTIDKNLAVPGEYRFEVDELAQKSSAMSSGFSDPEESYIGVGFIQYFLPDGSVRDLYVDSDHASLRGIAKLINGDPSNRMRANVVNDGSGTDTPWRLVISLEETGDDNYAEFPHLYFVDGENDFYLEFEREAHDAVVKLDGFEIELPQNKTSTLIPGATIDLKKAKPGEEFSIKIEEDTKAIIDKIKVIIEKINAVLQFINTQNALDEKSDTSRTLGGDLTLQTLESRIRNVVFKYTSTEEGEKRVGDLGITFQKDGLLQFDEKKFEATIKKNYKIVSQILTGYMDAEGGNYKGFIDNFNELVDGVLKRPDGILPSRKNGLQTSMTQIDRQIENKQRMIDQREIILKDKFARLEGVIAKIKNQGAGLSAMAGGMDPVTQLGQSIE